MVRYVYLCLFLHIPETACMGSLQRKFKIQLKIPSLLYLLQIKPL